MKLICEKLKHAGFKLESGKRVTIENIGDGLDIKVMAQSLMTGGDISSLRNEAGASSALKNDPYLGKRWRELRESLGFQGDRDEIFRLISELYAQEGRHYHTLEHIESMLKEFDQVKAMAQDSLAIEFAIWLHDVIYNPRRRDNEEQSAEFAGKICEKMQLPHEFVEKVKRLILITKTHNISEGDIDGAILVDLDLASLGRLQEMYDAYRAKVEQEYGWLATMVRGGIFGDFLVWGWGMRRASAEAVPGEGQFRVQAGVISDEQYFSHFIAAGALQERLGLIYEKSWNFLMFAPRMQSIQRALLPQVSAAEHQEVFELLLKDSIWHFYSTHAILSAGHLIDAFDAAQYTDRHANMSGMGIFSLRQSTESLKRIEKDKKVTPVRSMHFTNGLSSIRRAREPADVVFLLGDSFKAAPNGSVERVVSVLDKDGALYFIGELPQELKQWFEGVGLRESGFIGDEKHVLPQLHRFSRDSFRDRVNNFVSGVVR